MFGFKLPKDFLIGTANSAFQSEGAWEKDGKALSMMEHYAKEYAGQPSGVARDGAPYSMELPDRGCFFYDNYAEYIEDMKKTGQNTYRKKSATTPIVLPICVSTCA